VLTFRRFACGGSKTLSPQNVAKPVANAVTLRPVVTEDEAFLLTVYASTREREMALTDWLEVQKQAFIKTQFTLQQQGYKKQFPDACNSIILFNGEPAGRLIVDRSNENELRGVDIAMLPAYRNAGIGSYLVKELLHEAAAARKPFRIQVEIFNYDAIRLYERLGFSKTGESHTHIAMEHNSLS
jgi:ribosomal protein S18 acetylase RimI-like enzyme